MVKKVRFDPFYISIRFSISCVLILLPAQSQFFFIHSLIYFVYSTFSRTSNSSCLDVVKEERPRPSQRPDPSGLDSSSQSDVYIDSFAKDTTLTELAQALQFIWLLFSSTCPPKSWSWQEMLQETTRRPELSLVISNWLSETTKN